MQEIDQYIGPLETLTKQVNTEYTGRRLQNLPPVNEVLGTVPEEDRVEVAAYYAQHPVQYLEAMRALFLAKAAQTRDQGLINSAIEQFNTGLQIRTSNAYNNLRPIRDSVFFRIKNTASTMIDFMTFLQRAKALRNASPERITKQVVMRHAPQLRRLD
jgi:DNA-directed RNA polymerase subunit L